MALNYTDPTRVLDMDTTPAPMSGQTISGYGGKIPTRYRVRYDRPGSYPRWHRVYVMQYGNAGSPYIIVGGEILHLDTDTEHRLQELA